VVERRLEGAIPLKLPLFGQPPHCAAGTKFAILARG
jgi:hypothetical protein